MCGRFVLHAPRSHIAQKHFGIPYPVGDQIDDYNIAPGTQITLITASLADPTISADFLFSWWGFRPQWVKDKNAPSPINARAETVATSRYFQRSFARHRGLVPANGWYEWREEQGRKQPYYITHTDGDPLMFAAIYEPTGIGMDTCCAIITQPAYPEISVIHERMPVVLDPSCWQDWMDPDLTDRETIRRVAKPLRRELIEAYPVTTAVNSTRNNGPELIERRLAER